MIIERGSFITGLKKSSKETGLTIRNIRTARETLVNLGMIAISTTKTTTRFTYLTVCNYDKYQLLEKGSRTITDNQATTERQSSDNQATTNKKVKNVKNEEENTPPNPPQIPNQLAPPKNGGGDKNKEKIKAVFDYWNSQKIIVHRNINGCEGEINARLKEYSVEEIKEAIGNYAKILKDKDYQWSWRYPLKDFLGREKDNIARFLTASKPFDSLPKVKKPPSGEITMEEWEKV